MWKGKIDEYQIVIITPCFNASKNLENIANSLLEQTYKEWVWIIADDVSTDDTRRKAIEIINNINGRACLYPVNRERQIRRYALHNICNIIENKINIVLNSRNIGVPSEKVIIGIIDGDDQLCNKNALQLIVNEYEAGNDVVWTAHKWDVNSEMNISGPMPNNVNPYFYQWCSSHFRTFRKDLFDKVNKDNFKDINGEWFKRGYDQALMLPIIYLSKNRKYVDKVCYQYNINSVSMDRSLDTTSEQLKVVKFIRSRGFIK